MNNGMLLYIDPGTGSMLFTIILGIVGTGMFFAKKLWLKIKFRFSSGMGAKEKAGLAAEEMPYVIFSDSRIYWYIYKPVCDEFEKRKLPLVYWTASPDDPALETKYEYVKCEFIGEGNKAFARLNLMNAAICLSTTPGLDVYQWKRSRSVKYYVHMLHETGSTLLYRMFGIDFYDAILLTGDFQTDEVRDLEKVWGDDPKELEVVGCPYMDELKKRLDEEGTVENERKTVLLASSWGESSVLSLYGEELIDSLIATGYRLVIRPHPQSMRSEKEMLDRLMKKYPETDDIKWNFDADNFEVLRHADIMISDFSGVIFDYALVFDKPVIYAEQDFDPAPYDAYWVDHKIWKFEILPEIGKPLSRDQFGNMKEVIDNMSDSDEFAKGREKARRESWAYIGKGAEHIVDYLTGLYIRLQKEKEDPDAKEKTAEKKGA